MSACDNQRDCDPQLMSGHKVMADRHPRLLAHAPDAVSAPGQTLVEFALIATILLILLIGIFDAGRAVYALSTINNAAREAARVAIVDQTLSHIQGEAQAQSIGLGIPVSQIAVVYREFDDSADCISQTAPPVGCLAAVTVTYNYAPVMGQLLGSFTLTGQSFFPIEATCVEPPEAKCPKGD